MANEEDELSFFQDDYLGDQDYGWQDGLGYDMQDDVDYLLHEKDCDQQDDWDHLQDDLDYLQGDLGLNLQDDMDREKQDDEGYQQHDLGYNFQDANQIVDVDHEEAQVYMIDCGVYKAVIDYAYQVFSQLYLDKDQN